MIDFIFHTHSTQSIDETVDYIKNCNRSSLLKLTLFINITDNTKFSEFCNIINIAKKDNQNFLISIIALAPVDDSFCIFEILELNNITKANVTYFHSKSISYCTIKNEDSLTLITSSIPNIGTKSTSISSLYKETYKSFELLKNILISKKMCFSDVVRQWSYIEKIIDKEVYENGEKQYYQVFNDIRSHFYRNEPFENGLMAATAVGSFAGVFSTEIIAIRPNNDNIKIVPIKNPNQKEAFSYNENKLIGTPLELTKKLTTPKFSRAKLIYSESEQIFFISGTSAVIGEESVSVGDTLGQLEVTLKNIEALLNEQNNLYSKKLNKSSVKLLRIYLTKTNIDIEIKKIFEQEFQNAKIILVNAIVCRNNLNIEIEGVV